MQVESLECQLTQAQLKRHLNGQVLPDALLDQLERHLQSCPDCLSEGRKLRRELGGGDSAEEPPKSSPMAAVLQQVRKAVERPTPATLLDPPGRDGMPPSVFEVLKQPRNLALSVGLAVVLVLMSTVLRDPTGLLGNRATALAQAEKAKLGDEEEPTSLENTDEKKPTAHEEPDEKKPAAHESDHSEEKPAPVKKEEPAKEEKPADHHGEATKPSVKPPIVKAPLGGEILVADSTPIKPKAKSTVKPKPQPRVVSQRRKAVRRQPPARPAAPTNRIRVYDESGKPKKTTP